MSVAECVAIVLIPRGRYRKIAQKHWGLTDEQMKGMQVHHRIAVSDGGTNDPSNLYVCCPWFHSNIWHGEDSCSPMVEWCSENGRKGGKRSQEVQKGPNHPLTVFWREGQGDPEEIFKWRSEGGKKGGSKSGPILRDQGLGIFGRDPEQHRKDTLKGVKTQMDNQVGIHDPDNPNLLEWRRKGARAMNSQKWQSLIDPNIISTAAGIVSYHKGRGWDPNMRKKFTNPDS